MGEEYGTRHWPVEIRVKSAERALEIDFDDGKSIRLPAELLRVESPSAEVRGHGAGQKTVLGGKRLVGIKRLEPVGNYAVRIHFDDGHDTGIFSWSYLHELGETRDAVWRAYLSALAERALSREP
ncbi:MAG: gamma-butyrobetaine hydroxylase-like domain-containing protein [Alphaproteobacteria bacterium]